MVLIVAFLPLAGCVDVDNPFEDDVVPDVLSRCRGLGASLTVVPEPQPLEKRPPTSGDTPPPPPGTVRITVLTDAQSGPEAMRGARLAVTELNAAGARISLEEVPVSGAATLAAFRGITQINPPSAVVSALDNASTEAVIDEAHQRRVPVLATAATAESLVSNHTGRGYFFRMAPADAVEGRALAELVWSAGCRTANVLVGSTPLDDDVRVAFRAAFEAKGGSVGAVVRTTNTSDAVTRTEFLGKPGKDEPRPDAIVLLTNAEAAGRFLREAYDRKVTAHSALFFHHGGFGPELVTTAGTDANGHLLAADLRGTAAMRADTTATAAFFRTYARAHGEAAATNQSMRAYDAVYATALAAACARNVEPRLVAAKLATVMNADTGDTRVSGADPEQALSVAPECLVDYVGATHNYDWSTGGEPVTGRFFVWTVGTDGGLRTLVPRFEPPQRP